MLLTANCDQLLALIPRKQAYYFGLYYAPLIMFVIASFASFTIPPLGKKNALKNKTIPKYTR